MNLSVNEQKVLAELRSNVESSGSTPGWGMVYLDNCPSSGSLFFSGVLSSLEKKGFYQECGEEYKAFGEVKLEEKQ